jgi:acetyl-CoA carboxylase biotin carboxyl carrier protein
MDLKEIKNIVELMTRNGLTEFDWDKGDQKLRIKRGPETPAVVTSVAPAALPVAIPPMMMNPVAAAAAAPAPGAAPGAAPAPDPTTREIVAPMVGTFYRSPSPDSPPYIEVGKEITPDTVVCIIEAMKVMNEIKAEIAGTITEVLAESGKPVEFGKPLFRVKPL